MEHEDLTTTIRSSGLKNTKHRIRMLEILERSSQPISADRIYARLKEMFGRISLSTVYRSLEALVKNGIVNKISFENNPRTAFEMNRRIHHHFLVCLGCEKIVTLDDCPIKDYERELSESRGFEVIGHKLEIYGYCPDCAKKQGLASAGHP